MATTIRGTIHWMAALANPAFAVGEVLVPVVALAYAIALGIVTVLPVLGFGVLLPGEVRMYREMVSVEPDREVIGAIGLRNAKLSGIQGVFQLAIIVVMVLMRWSWY